MSIKVIDPNKERFLPVTIVFETWEQWNQFREDVANTVENDSFSSIDDINQIIN